MIWLIWFCVCAWVVSGYRAAHQVLEYGRPGIPESIVWFSSGMALLMML